MSLTTRDNVCMSNGGLAIGSATAKAQTTNAITFTINGRTYNKAATDDLFTLAGTALAARQTCVFWLWLNASGTASVTQSAIKEASTSTSTTARYVAGGFEWPDVVDKCCVGALHIVNGASAFTPGTTALTTITTYVNAGPDYSAPITY
jgi:hypothetical protein